MVDLRFDMNVLVVLSTAPHPLDTAKAYQPADVLLTAWHAGHAAEMMFAVTRVNRINAVLSTLNVFTLIRIGYVN